MKTTDTTNEVAIQTPLIDILRSVPKSCREMIQDGEHSHRNIPYGRLCHEAATELAEKTNEVARLRKYFEKIEIYSPENEWSLPEWRKLMGSKEEQEDPEILFKLYQFRLAPEPEEPVSDWKCPHCGSTTGTWFSRVEPMGDICEDCGKAVDDENWNLKEIPQEEKAPNHLHAWMQLQESINKDISGELQNLRDEIQKLKQTKTRPRLIGPF